MSLSEIASKALSPEQLKEFLDCIIHKRWPILSNKNIQKYIILQSYCSLWSGDEAQMHKYFFKDAHDLSELKQLLKNHDLFGPKYTPRSNRDTHYPDPTVIVEDTPPEYRDSQRRKRLPLQVKKKIESRSLHESRLTFLFIKELWYRRYLCYVLKMLSLDQSRGSSSENLYFYRWRLL
jgi:hypothetical protein